MAARSNRHEISIFIFLGTCEHARASTSIYYQIEKTIDHFNQIELNFFLNKLSIVKVEVKIQLTRKKRINDQNINIINKLAAKIYYLDGFHAIFCGFWPPRKLWILVLSTDRN